MDKNYSIIGAGITGCALAIYLKKKLNKDVSIYEISSKVGGVLRDLNFNNEKFFNGVQYLSNDKTWINFIAKDKDFKNIFWSFQDNCGSYTSFEGEEIYSSEFPCPVFKSKIDLNNLKILKPAKNLTERINLYPKSIAEHLMKWVKKYEINTDLLSSKCASNGLMLNKILLKDNNLSDIKNLKNNKIFDDLYGLPRKELNYPKINVLVPKEGYDIFFSKIENFLKRNGINIHLNSSIRPKWENNKLIVKKFSENINAQKIIWTANPTKLIESYNLKKIDSYPLFIKTFTSNLEIDLKKLFYVNIFSHELDIFRVFLHKIGNKSKITFECFDKITDIKKDLKR